MGASPVSFALQVKEEISSLSLPEEALRPLLSGYAKCAGSIRMSSSGNELDLVSESSKVAKLLYGAISSIYGSGVRFAYSKMMGFSKRTRFHVLAKEADYILSDLGVDLLSPALPKGLLTDEKDEQSYLAGCFLARGSVNDPHSSSYHLEIALDSEKLASMVSSLINHSKSFPFSSHVAKRRQQWIVYLKRAEQISSFLTYIGATASCLYFEQIRVDRDFANLGNRFNNLDSANMGKTLGASKRQLDEIAHFDVHGTFPKIESEKLRALMAIRKLNPDATLAELSALLSEQLNTEVSKSNVNHLFRKLHELYLQDNGDAE